MNDRELARWAEMDGSSRGWSDFKTHVAALPPETAFVQLRTLGERLPIDADLDSTFRDDSDVLGLTINGAALMVRATRIRGMDLAERVRERNWPEYWACRDQAERILRHAVRVEPTNGLAVAWLAAAAVDSDDDLKETVAGLVDGARDLPISAYSKVLSGRTEKWGGSHSEMWAAARKFAPMAEPWTLSLIAKAHYENWLYLAMMDERPVADWEAGAYFRDNAVREELLAISEQTMSAESEDPYASVYAHDVLAAALAEAGLRKQATRHLRKVGRFGDPALLTGGPWWRRSLIRASRGLRPW